MSRKVYILYEDQRGPQRQFAPHVFVVQCVADELGQQAKSLTGRLEPIPCKGDSKLLAKLENELDPLVRSGNPVVAVMDDDQIRQLLKLDRSTKKREVAAHIRTRAAGSSVTVRLLVKNMETLVEACAAQVGDPPPEKGHKSRDAYLQRGAWELGPQDRRAIRAAVPSFDCLVQVVAHLVR